MSTPPSVLWQQAEQDAARGQMTAARACYEALAQNADWAVPAHLRLSMMAQAQGQLQPAVDAILAASAGVQDEGPLAAAVVRQAFDLGEIEAGLKVACEPVVTESADTQVLLDVAQALCDQSFPDLALPLLETVAGLGDRGARLFYLLGVARTFAGDLTGAAASYEQCLRLQPDNAAAHYMLAGLLRQTREHNHIPRLRAALKRAGAGHSTAPFFHFALFKELDDLGEVDEAWGALSAGMRAHRARVQHDVDHQRELFQRLGGVGPGSDDAMDQAIGPCPIFIVGMPRSGTTLLERVLGGHSQVADAGELRDFSFQARVVSGCPGPLDVDVPLAKALSDGVSWAALGSRYLSHTQWRARGRPFYTDKLPTNFMSVGWIAKALPRARFIHMVREPMDVCFSNLKQLFAPGNAHSFELTEMAEHYVHYRALMQHWHQAFPGRIHDVHYLDLVQHPERTAREVLAFCGLAWEPAVIAVEARVGAVATASMVQVREAIHTRYVGQWQRYAQPLEPLRSRLAAAGF